MYNRVILVGNLTRDVELKYTPNGIAIAKFGLATNRSYKDNTTGELKQETMFIDITVFGRSAEVANQYLKKGKRVLIEGRLVFDQWIDSSGQKRSKHSIIAEKIQFMDSKESSNYLNQSYDNPIQQQAPMKQQKNNIPSIDIDDDEIPF